MDEVLQVASLGAQQGCAEILFTLGVALLAHIYPSSHGVSKTSDSMSCALQYAASMPSSGDCVGRPPGEGAQLS